MIGNAQPPVPTLLRFYELLMQGDVNTLLSLFVEEPLINTPQQGEVKGKEAFRQFVAKQQAFLTDLHAQSHVLNTIITPDRVIVEFIIDMVQNKEMFDLPAAVIFERSVDHISAIRVYHSTWPLTGSHIIRTPLLKPPVETPVEPEIIETYMKGISEPDEKLVLSLFVKNGYLREPSGSRYKHEGEEGRQGFYDVALANGGISLKHCTATFDGTRFAVEYICDEWGQAKLTPQAGMAVYELVDAEHLLAVRIYDDVTPPSEKSH